MESYLYSEESSKKRSQAIRRACYNISNEKVYESITFTYKRSAVQELPLKQ